MRILYKILFALFFILPAGSMAGNGLPLTDLVKPEVGDTLVIKEPVGIQFRHIYFPKPNIIHKKTGKANYKDVRGMEVTVSSVEEKNGRVIVTLQPVGGKKFFRFWGSVKADYQLAMESGELAVP